MPTSIGNQVLSPYKATSFLTDKLFMKMVFLLTFFLVSCGVDQLNKTATTASSISQGSTASSTMSCLCTSDYNPVCGSTDKKSYENACLAKCFLI